jgi:hypothetical protein
MNASMKGVLAALALGLGSEALAQSPAVYPAQGQNAQQQNKDQGDCYAWAANETGSNAATMGSSGGGTQQSGGGERMRGAARGAVGGAAVGAIAGDTSKGAAVGAGVGTVAGGRRARQNRAADEQAQATQQASVDSYNRAYAACMSGRGYSVQP